MIRRPLRPIARVLKARESGLDPALIEAEEKAARMRGQRKSERRHAEVRLLFLALGFISAFGAVGYKMSELAFSEVEEPQVARTTVQIVNQRADIVDRNGDILATNLITSSLFAHPREIVDARAAANGLAEIFSDLDAEKLYGQLAGPSSFFWIKRKLSPEQQQAVFELGEPGLHLGPRELRLYPNGNLAAHIMGGTTFGREGSLAAEVIGTAGVELEYDDFLRDPSFDGSPLELSINISIQAAMRRVLAGGMEMMNAKGAAAVLMDVNTGQIIAMVSLPDFDPNHRPSPLTSGDQADSPLFNRAAQGIYELGSTFKMFTAALALESGMVNPDTMIDTKGPIIRGEFEIDDLHKYGSRLSLTDVIVKSSNVGSANLAIMNGPDAQQDFLDTLGFLDPLALEMREARQNKPQFPKDWTELSAMTISYGHGLAATPVHLAAAYASLTNGGLRVVPTLLKNSELPDESDRVISEQTSAQLRDMLRQVVTRGTASLGEVVGYQVGGKTGTADKPNPKGGYYDDQVITTFASIFPTDDPQYVLVVTLDEPVDKTGSEDRRTAGWTAVPVSAEIIRRIAPLMGIRPEWFDNNAESSFITLTSN